MLKKIILPVCFLLPNLSLASLATFDSGTEKLESHTLAKSAKIMVDGKELTLSLVGAGLRTKKVLFVNVKVYVGEFFAENPTKFERTEDKALESLSTQTRSAIRLNFLRSVDAEKIESSFIEALTANGASKTEAGISEFLAAVKSSGEAKEGKSMVFLLTKENDKTETVEFQNGDSKPTKISGPTGLIKKIISIWLGKPADDGLNKMKSEILR